MEMTKVDENIQTAQNMLSGIVERCYELEKENINLRFKLGESQTNRWADVKDLKNKIEQQKSALKSMEKENKELKAIIEHYKKFEEGKEKLEGMLMEEDTLQELRDLGEI